MCEYCNHSLFEIGDSDSTQVTGFYSLEVHALLLILVIWRGVLKTGTFVDIRNLDV